MAGPLCDFNKLLHLGTEINVYKAGTDCVTQFFHETAPSIEELIQKKQEEEILSSIAAAHEQKSVDPTQIICILAHLTKYNSEKLSCLTYKTFTKICRNTKDLFLFVKMCKKFNNSNLGTGSGMRNLIKRWYTTKSTDELLSAVTQFRGAHSWKNSDLLKLAHVKPETKEQEIIFTYILFNFDKAKLIGCRDEYPKLFAYLEAVEEVKHSEDIHAIERLFENYNLQIEHLPNEVLAFKKLWEKIMIHMSFKSVLFNLNRLSRQGFFSPGSALIPIVIKCLLDEQKIFDSGLYPEEILFKFKECMMHTTGANSNRKRSNNSPVNQEIVNCLPQMLKISSKVIPPLDKKLCFMLDTPVRSHYVECCGTSATYLDVISIMILRFATASIKVDVIRNSVDGYRLILGDQDYTFDGIKRALHKEVGYTPFDHPSFINSLREMQLNPDVFIHFQPNYKSGSEFAATTLEAYKMKKDVPDARFISMSLLENPKSTIIGPDHPGVLSVIGFDVRVTRIVEAFLRQHF